MLPQQKKISDYRLASCIGKGCFGIVWLAKHKQTSQVCAIKVLEKQQIRRSGGLIAIAKEAMIMRKLRYAPSVLQLIDFFSNDRYAFMVLELAELGNLGEVRARLGPLDREQMRYYLVEIAQGLVAIHTKEIIYRDLKPENALLTADGHVKLADFGLSKFVGNLHGRAQSYCGTFPYMAPEILRGDWYTYSVDWYSLGILLHVLHAGCYPFARGVPPESGEELLRIVDEGLVISPKIDADGQSFIRWLTDKDPKKRPQSLNNLREHPWVPTRDEWKDIIRFKITPPVVMSAEDRIAIRSLPSQMDHSDRYEVQDEEAETYGNLFAEFE